MICIWKKSTIRKNFILVNKDTYQSNNRSELSLQTAFAGCDILAGIFFVGKYTNFDVFCICLSISDLRILVTSQCCFLLLKAMLLACKRAAITM